MGVKGLDHTVVVRRLSTFGSDFMLVDRIDEELKSGNRFGGVYNDLVFRFIEKPAAKIVNPGPVCMEVAWIFPLESGQEDIIFSVSIGIVGDLFSHRDELIHGPALLHDLLPIHSGLFEHRRIDEVGNPHAVVSKGPGEGPKFALVGEVF